MVLALSNSYHSCCSVRSLKQQGREEGVLGHARELVGVGVGGVVQELMGWGWVG